MLALLMAATQTAWADGTFSGGDGSQANPYQISSVDDWNALAKSVNDGTSTYSNTYFKLTTARRFSVGRDAPLPTEVLPPHGGS